MAEKRPARGKTAGDDRNLVDNEASEGSLDLESWVISFWHTNRKTILTAIMLALIIVVGLQLYRIISAQREASTLRAYTEATTDDALKAFADAHRGHPLAGAAYLTVADDAYARGDYGEATGYYEQAQDALDIPALIYRAQLGRAASQIQAGLMSKGEPILIELADNEGAPDAVRSESLFHLASLAVEAGEVEKAGRYLDRIEELAPVGIWASRAGALRNTLPVPVEE
jgi:tetratricopeptide (TPR) repeat protein